MVHFSSMAAHPAQSSVGHVWTSAEATAKARLSAKPMGRWLVDNMPRGADLVAVERREPGRPVPFIDERRE